MSGWALSLGEFLAVFSLIIGLFRWLRHDVKGTADLARNNQRLQAKRHNRMIRKLIQSGKTCEEKDSFADLIEDE